MKYELTQHAQIVMAERGIAIEWLEVTLSEPELVLPDAEDRTVERYFRQIPEFGGRVLRVAVNTKVEPVRVVSIFFDRTMKGKL
jgi:hypothetical protein